MANIVKENVTQLLSKEMSRADFMKHIGVAIVALTGATAVVNALAGGQKHVSTGGSQKVQAAYGSMSYGGK